METEEEIKPIKIAPIVLEEVIRHLQSKIDYYANEKQNVSYIHGEAALRRVAYEEILQYAKLRFLADEKIEVGATDNYPQVKRKWATKILFITENTTFPLRVKEVVHAILEREPNLKKELGYEKLRTRLAPVVTKLIGEGKLRKYRVIGTKGDFKIVWSAWVDKFTLEGLELVT